MNRLFTLIIAFLCSVVAMAQAELSTPFTPDARWEQLKPGLHATWTDTDVLTSKYACPVENSRTLNLSGWRGERIHAKLLVYARSEQEHVNFTVLPSESKKWIDTTTTGFMRYVMTDELNKDGKGGCGYRPDKTLFDSLLVDDRIDTATRMAYQPCTVRPAWLTFDIPYQATPGKYRGVVAIRNAKDELVELKYTITVSKQTLPTAQERKFHLDLWQNPFSVARYVGVPLWSDEHFDAMQPLMQRVARAGARGITTSITHKPWNGQTYDYFENMITEVRRIDGTWSYDFTLFDRYVEFMQRCGLGPYVYCYSVIPWELTFRYYDQATNRMADQKMNPNDDAFDDYWVSKLTAFAQHLKAKGWFDRTIIAMDERPEEHMKAALRVIRKADARFKISLAGNYHEALNEEIFDYCIGYDSHYPDGVVKARKEQGKITTYYTCCTEAFPNTFSFSQPVEAAVLPLIAEQRGLDGYLRWAYNSWVATPLTDTRFTAWAGGDTYLVYPGNQASVRFEKLIEGIQLFEKLQVLKAQGREREVQQKLRLLAYEHIRQVSLGSFLHQLQRWCNR